MHFVHVYQSGIYYLIMFRDTNNLWFTRKVSVDVYYIGDFYV